jgi:hypothetical protein
MDDEKVPEYKDTYTTEEKFKTCIYVDTDELGNITLSYIGKDAIPDKQYNYFFYDEAYVGDSIRNYKIVLENNIPRLESIDKELEQRLKDAYNAVDKEQLQLEYQQKLDELALLESQLNSI